MWWDIDGNGVYEDGTDYQFDASTDISKATLNSALTVLTVTLDSTFANSTFEADAKFSNLDSALDKLVIENGFVTDKAGNAADVDGSGSDDSVTLSLGFEGYGATISVDSFEASVETDNTPGDDLYGVGDVIRVYALVDQPVLAGSQFEAQIDVNGNGSFDTATDVTLTMVSDGIVSYTDPDTFAVTSATQVFYADYTVDADHDMDTLKVFALVDSSETITGQYKTATDTTAAKTFNSTNPPDDPNNISTVQSTTPTFEIDGIAPVVTVDTVNFDYSNNEIVIKGRNFERLGDTDVTNLLGSHASASLTWSFGDSAASSPVDLVPYIQAASVNSAGTEITISLSSNIVKDDPDYARSEQDNVTISQYFFTDTAGNSYSGTAQTEEVIFETIRPNFVNFTSPDEATTYKSGDTIDIVAVFDEELQGGTLTAVLNTGDTVVLAWDESNPNELSTAVSAGTAYNVSSSDAANPLRVDSVTQSDIKDIHGNPVNTISITATNNLQADTRIVVDNQPTFSDQQSVGETGNGEISSGDIFKFRFAKEVAEVDDADPSKKDIGEIVEYLSSVGFDDDPSVSTFSWPDGTNDKLWVTLGDFATSLSFDDGSNQLSITIADVLYADGTFATETFVFEI